MFLLVKILGVNVEILLGIVVFFTCDDNGNEIEPTLNSDWKNLYICASCGKIYEVD